VQRDVWQRHRASGKPQEARRRVRAPQSPENDSDGPGSFPACLGGPFAELFEALVGEAVEASEKTPDAVEDRCRTRTAAMQKVGSGQRCELRDDEAVLSFQTLDARGETHGSALSKREGRGTRGQGEEGGRKISNLILPVSRPIR